MRCESNSKYTPAALRATPLLAFARFEGSPFGWFSGGSQPLRSGDALTPFGGGLRFAGPDPPISSTAGRLDSPGRPAPLSLRSSRPSGQPAGLFYAGTPGHRCDGRRPPSQSLPLPWERRSPARRVRREGDTRLSPGATQGRESGRTNEIYIKLNPDKENRTSRYPESK